MIVKLKIAKEGKKRFVNPDWVLEKLSGRVIQMSNGFSFRLPRLWDMDYEGKHKGSLVWVGQLEFEFTIPVGRVRDNWFSERDYRTPKFEQQVTWFEVVAVIKTRSADERYLLNVKTTYEVQKL